MMKRYNGSSWIDAQFVRRYNGTSWVDIQFARRYNGNSWVDVWDAGDTNLSPSDWSAFEGYYPFAGRSSNNVVYSRHKVDATPDGIVIYANLNVDDYTKTDFLDVGAVFNRQIDFSKYAMVKVTLKVIRVEFNNNPHDTDIHGRAYIGFLRDKPYRIADILETPSVLMFHSFDGDIFNLLSNFQFSHRDEDVTNTCSLVGVEGVATIGLSNIKDSRYIVVYSSANHPNDGDPGTIEFCLKKIELIR